MPNDDKTLPPDGKGVDQSTKAYAERAAAYLSARGISTSWAMKCGIDLHPPARRNGFNGAATKDKERAGAIVFPYFDHDGKQRNFKRWRLFDADHKFDQDPGTGVHVYMPPLRHKTLTLRAVLSDPTQPLNIAEGETRAVVLNYHGRPTVAIGGIDNWGSGGELCGDLLRIQMQGRHVRLLIDADVPRRKDKQRSVVRFTRKLLEQGAARVDWIPAPDLGDGVSGFDDLIAKHGIGEFDKIVKHAKPSTHPDFASWGDDGIDIDLALAPIGREWLQEAPPVLEWTWAGYLPRGAVALLIAQGGAGKTFFVQRLMQCIAGGIPFLGHETHQGKTVHIACEDGTDELRRRQFKTFRHETASMDAAKVKRFASALQENLYVRSVVGQQMHLVATDGNNVIQGRALDVLIHQLKALGGVEIVAIDPLSRAHSVPDESQAWGTAIVNACERIAKEVGCAVLVPHHPGKSSEREDLYAARGASALADAARVVLQLKVVKPADCRGVANITDEQASSGQILRLINSKLSYGPTQRETWLYRAEGGVLDRFEPELRRTAFADDNTIKMLREWWEANERKPLFPRTVRLNAKKIFKGALSSRMAVKVFEGAIQEGRLVLVTNESANGRGYVFSGEVTP